MGKTSLAVQIGLSMTVVTELLPALPGFILAALLESQDLLCQAGKLRHRAEDISYAPFTWAPTWVLALTLLDIHPSEPGLQVL